ncbi:MAG: helix-turn-helix transcriptional regulator [Micrococcales bacterium]|uniref:response regulator transcription factor n=1 Tax=Phycicoccus sp. TaxID=1902410 RepID=UPI0019AD8D4B|nr:helix-turn-helix transcriptional regulator [Phycicoccus sp.]MBD3781859.1 helix-turn-helix transcriptional regulator [Micrococcales bacterium]HMM94637.1 helix-turn-helix transcriptional regulator [Phycicoccus sp.]
MARGLTATRVRQDVDIVARAGLDLDAFFGEAVESIRRAVPWDAACVATHDPGTSLLTSARKYGHLAEVDSHDLEFGVVEYGTVEPSAFTELSRAAVPAAGVHVMTHGEVERSHRMASFMQPHFGFGDEARLIFRDDRNAWGALALFRGPDDPPFAEDEIDFLASLSGTFAHGVRTGLLAGLGDPTLAPTSRGPAVAVVDAAGELVRMTPGTEDRLEDLRGGAAGGDPVTPLYALVGAARRYARGEVPNPPRSRIRGASGMWLVLHAAPLVGRDGHVGEVAVTIEEARPPEIVGLVVAAFGLTPRERDVTQLVLQGEDTRAIASTLHLSAWTVQDHLKSVFDKAGVRTRQQLVSRVYFDQYVPRMGEAIAPAGWFA